MAEFVLNRNHLLRSVTGHSVQFKKGIPVNVPSSVVKEVLAIGGERVDAPQDASFEEPALIKAEPEGDEREALVFKCFGEMVERGARTDFTAQGVPHVKALQAALGFEMSNKERDGYWQAYKEAKAEEEAQA